MCKKLYYEILKKTIWEQVLGKYPKQNAGKKIIKWDVKKYLQPRHKVDKVVFSFKVSAKASAPATPIWLSYLGEKKNRYFF